MMSDLTGAASIAIRILAIPVSWPIVRLLAPITKFIIWECWNMRYLVLFLLLSATSAWALTNQDATVLWDKTTDSASRYEIRWKHFANNWQWVPVATDLDSTSGTYQHNFAAFADSTGDRGACWDSRAIKNGLASQWTSELHTQACVQIPLAAAPPPLDTDADGIPDASDQCPAQPGPAPSGCPAPPPPSGLSVVSATPQQIIITATVADCSRVVTSTKGSTPTLQKRTITCVK